MLQWMNFSYLVDRLAVGLGDKHGCDRVADNWMGDLVY